MGLDQYIMGHSQDGETEDTIVSFRKNNQLHNRMVGLLTPNGEDSGSWSLPLERHMVEGVVGDCEKILNKFDEMGLGSVSGVAYPDKFIDFCEGILPPKDGFYFGDTYIGESYVWQIEGILKKMQEVLDVWDDYLQVSYSCWW